MIQLTRLRHDDFFFVNPDLIERVDCHVDTVVHLTNGTEYVVVESGQEIIARIAEFRAKVLALVPVVRIETAGELVASFADLDDDPRGPGGGAGR